VVTQTTIENDATHRRHTMKTADLTNQEMLDAWYENDPAMHVKVNFPFFAGTGNKASSTVYFEIEPGRYLGTHTDSAEEILFILSGSVEASLGEEKGELTAGQAVLIPEMVPHGLRNISSETVRCAGFFAAATVVSTFDQPMMPFGQQAVGTPAMEVAL
jgi:quercetin dioxygenase-like cupin family protein